MLGQLGHDRFDRADLLVPVPHLTRGQWAGHDPDSAAQAAVVLWFDGPMAEPMVKAARYGGEHRVTPAIQATPGTVRGFALFDPDRRAACVMNLVTSVEALDDLAAAVNRTELLPGEDPALLPGPDRAETYRVLSFRRGSHDHHHHAVDRGRHVRARHRQVHRHFSVKHMFGVGTVQGRSHQARRGVRGRGAARCYVDAVLDAASFHTGNPRRDKDIRSARFLDVANHRSSRSAAPACG